MTTILLTLIITVLCVVLAVRSPATRLQAVEGWQSPRVQIPPEPVI